MTRYSRSDLRAVNPADGCPPGHVREPGPDGTHTGPWALDCPMCEVALASDPHWAGDPSEVPATPEETRQQARLAEQGQNNAGQMAAFFGQMMQAFQMQQGQVATQAPVVACASCGVPGMQGARFCAGCGAPVTIAAAPLLPQVPAIDPPSGGVVPPSEPVEARVVAGEYVLSREQMAETAEPGWADVSESTPEPHQSEALSALTIVQLRAKAKTAGLSQAGSKADLVARLETAAQ